MSVKVCLYNYVAARGKYLLSCPPVDHEGGIHVDEEGAGAHPLPSHSSHFLYDHKNEDKKHNLKNDKEMFSLKTSWALLLEFFLSKMFAKSQQAFFRHYYFDSVFYRLTLIKN